MNVTMTIAIVSLVISLLTLLRSIYIQKGMGYLKKNQEGLLGNQQLLAAKILPQYNMLDVEAPSITTEQRVPLLKDSKLIR